MMLVLIIHMVICFPGMKQLISFCPFSHIVSLISASPSPLRVSADSYVLVQATIACTPCLKKCHYFVSL